MSYQRALFYFAQLSRMFFGVHLAWQKRNQHSVKEAPSYIAWPVQASLGQGL